MYFYLMTRLYLRVKQRQVVAFVDRINAPNASDAEHVETPRPLARAARDLARRAQSRRATCCRASRTSCARATERARRAAAGMDNYMTRALRYVARGGGAARVAATHRRTRAVSPTRARRVSGLLPFSFRSRDSGVAGCACVARRAS